MCENPRPLDPEHRRKNSNRNTNTQTETDSDAADASEMQLSTAEHVNLSPGFAGNRDNQAELPSVPKIPLPDDLEELEPDDSRPAFVAAPAWLSGEDVPEEPPYYQHAPAKSWARYINPDLSRPYRDGRVLYVLYVLERWTLREMGAVFGVVKETIRQWLSRHDIERRAATAHNTQHNPFTDYGGERFLYYLHHELELSPRQIAARDDVPVYKETVRRALLAADFEFRHGVGGRDRRICSRLPVKPREYIQYVVGSDSEPETRVKLNGQQLAAIIGHEIGDVFDGTTSTEANEIECHHVNRLRVDNRPSNIQPLSAAAHHAEHLPYRTTQHVWIYVGKLAVTGVPGDTLVIDDPGAAPADALATAREHCVVPHDGIEISIDATGRPATETVDGRMLVPYDTDGKPLAAPGEIKLVDAAINAAIAAGTADAISAVDVEDERRSNGTRTPASLASE